MLEPGLSAQRIYQDLRTEHGIELSYYAVRRFVRRLRCTSPMPYRRLEVDPGRKAQIDFGRGGLPQERFEFTQQHTIIRSLTASEPSSRTFQMSTRVPGVPNGGPTAKTAQPASWATAAFEATFDGGVKCSRIPCRRPG